MKQITLLALLILMTASSYAQDFLDGNFRFSSKKESYLTLTNGQEVVGFIDDIDRKKGLIEEIVIKDVNGKKIKYKPEEINFMYIAPSGFDKFGSGVKLMDDATKWSKDQSINKEHIKNGYALFQSTEVMIKKKKVTLLLQLLNPGFASKIKVYFDPLAGETTGLSMGGIKVAGGDAKSYYVKKGDEIAFKLQKKNYDEEFDHLYNDCPNMKKKFEKMYWTKFNEHVVYYDGDCLDN